MRQENRERVIRKSRRGWNRRERGEDKEEQRSEYAGEEKTSRVYTFYTPQIIRQLSGAVWGCCSNTHTQ